jgi:signal peptidase I
MNSQAKGKEMLGNVGLKLLAEGKTIKIKAHGYSMYPCIKPGTIVLIEPVRMKGKPVEGEILAILRGNGLVVHRLKEIKEENGKEYYIARGDSNIMPDEPVKSDKIAGRVTGTEINGIKNELSINTKPAYFLNRFRVNWIILWKKACKIIGVKQSS